MIWVDPAIDEIDLEMSVGTIILIVFACILAFFIIKAVILLIQDAMYYRRKEKEK